MMRAFALTLLLAACAHEPADIPETPPLPQRTGVDPIVAARAAGVEMRIVAEDFVIDLMRSEIVLTRADGARQVFPRPEPQQPRWAGEIYETRNETHTLSLGIHTSGHCARADTALYPTRVDVTLDGREIGACGLRL